MKGDKKNIPFKLIFNKIQSPRGFNSYYSKDNSGMFCVENQNTGIHMMGVVFLNSFIIFMSVLPEMPVKCLTKYF